MSSVIPIMREDTSSFQMYAMEDDDDDGASSSHYSSCSSLRFGEEHTTSTCQDSSAASSNKDISPTQCHQNEKRHHPQGDEEQRTVNGARIVFLVVLFLAATALCGIV